MRSLFAKIIAWFLAAMVITLAGFLVISTLSFTASRGRPNLFARMLAWQLEEARHAYETNGKPGLSAYFDRISATFQSKPILTDGDFRDLLTGRDRRDLLKESEHHGLFFRPPVIARASSDDRYWLFLIPPQGRSGFTFFVPQHLWIVVAMVLLSYLLALRLTAPLRRLQRAVERFGQGDLEARLKSTRKDEFGRLARAFDQMADRIQTLLAAERRLLMDISHELRSPLARLSVATELARSDDAAARESALNRIEKEAERLNVLVAELLQVTRVEGDPSTRHSEAVRVDELLTNVVDDCSVEASARGSRIEWSPVTPVVLQGDPELIRRAVENVLRNAIRHAPRDTAVEVGLENSGGTARICVRDSGPGVAPEHLARIFDPFYRVDSDRNRASGGVGLGLAIARRAVELHKGTIAARNADPGLLVEITLPVG